MHLLSIKSTILADDQAGLVVASCFVLVSGYWFPTYAKKQLRWVACLPAGALA
jgi:hypothetical protein